MPVDTFGRVDTGLRRSLTELGVGEVRFPGGDPLPRPGLAGIVERCAAFAPRPRPSLLLEGLRTRFTPTPRAASGLHDPSFRRPDRPMSALGG